MSSKRKRELVDFDPNKSDSDDENFEPDAEPQHEKKRSRPDKKGRRTPGTRRRRDRYGGAGIDDSDEELLDSQDDISYQSDPDDEEHDEEPTLTAAGRPGRKSAAKPLNYHESSGDEVDDIDVMEDDAEADDDDDIPPSKPPAAKTTRGRPAPRERAAARETTATPPDKTPPKRLIKLIKVPKAEASVPRMRSTRSRARTEEAELVELSNSGNHAVPARGSRSVSPEAAARALRSSRAMKGIKKQPEPIPEATQESSLPPSPEPRQIQEEDESERPQTSIEADDDDAEMADSEKEKDTVDVEPPAAGSPIAEDDEDDDDDDGPVTRRTRSARVKSTNPPPAEEAVVEQDGEAGNGRRRLTRKSGLRKKSLQEPSSDFEPGEDSGGEESGMESPTRDQEDAEDAEYESPSVRGRQSQRNQGRSARTSRRGAESADELVLDQNELAEELHELRQDSRSRRRRRSTSIIYQEPKRRRAAAKPVSYYMPPLNAAAIEEDEPEDPAPTPARRRGARGGASLAWERPLNTVYGPFGGGGGAGSLLGGPWGTGATVGGVDSDSSDDEMITRTSIAGNVGMTPTSAVAPGLLGGVGGGAGGDGFGGLGATPNVGKIKNQRALADADPLGVNLDVNFSQVGGLQGHIDKLKEMVQLPLLYPELFLKFHVTPPRGVLFHGPPGTGKTLLARALANSVSSGGKKISFYMRKGADALSKWVGEAEKQLRLLFEEARRTQPSIIFFDEIDGLAPVRSSKQEQIHASIVSTLLALMDGMDGRGQVIVIGATNRPDNIDPALRRPGRFDREFYFPLPDIEARRSIIDIHTKDWGLADNFKDALAERTKGYGGADLRALCTEAALNSIQRAYPQIYSSQEKLVVDADQISIHATDFMLSIKSMVPSSERSTTSGATSLPKGIEPLLRDQLQKVKDALDRLMPRKKKTTALEEAMYEQSADGDHGFGKEALHQEFERCRVYRPRLLIHGGSGMGQGYLASAILHYLEGVHVQTFDLPSLLADGRPMEQVIIGQFTEIKRHKPSVIYIPNIETWYTTLKDTLAMVTFQSMLKAISPTDPVLLFATAEHELRRLPGDLLKEFFGFSQKNRVEITRPRESNRREYFSTIIGYIKMNPRDFPDPDNRKKRVLEKLAVAPPPPPKVPSKAEMKALEKRDRQLLNVLKVQLQPIMDQINRKYKKFRQPAIPFGQLTHLYAEADPNHVRPDLAEGEVRPYEIAKDKYGNDVLRETATGKMFYNLETTTIEERLSNGFYARPSDFLFDITTLAKDSRNLGDKERTLKANELVSNVEVDVANVEHSNSTVDWEALYQRQLLRARKAADRERKRRAMQSIVDLVQSDVGANDSDSASQGPVRIGERIPVEGTTTARFQVMSPGPNGFDTSPSQNRLTNGTPQPRLRRASDVQMSGGDDDTQSFSQVPLMQPPPLSARKLGGETASGVLVTTQTQVSQTSAITSLPPGMSPSAVLNDASTTKTSDPSNRSSNFSQFTNGFHDGDNSLPDTLPLSQGGQSSSGEVWMHSQAHALASGMLRATGSMLMESPSSSSDRAQIFGSGARSGGTGSSGDNHPSSSNPHEAPRASGSGSGSGSRRDGETQPSGNSGPLSQQTIVIDDNHVRGFLDELTTRTSGCTIEQLEQINREMMEEVWRTRGGLNRMSVLNDVTEVFNATIQDIDSTQGVHQASQESEEEENES